MTSFLIDNIFRENDIAAQITLEPNQGTQSTPVYLRVDSSSTFFDYEQREFVNFTLRATPSNNPLNFTQEKFIIYLEVIPLK